jgi:hypothetical protein
MFYNKVYEDRLKIWHDFRDDLESSSDPIQLAIDTYNSMPNDSMCTDPFTPEMWPNPWELINENQYCAFTKLLGICYSLQLTERFSQEEFEIHIFIDREKSNHYYLLSVGKIVIGFDNYKDIDYFEMPKNCQPQMTHAMPALH